MRALSVLLASTSPARIALLRAAGVEFEAKSPGVDESSIHATTPQSLALARAHAKAAAFEQETCIVVGSDQVAHLDGACFGKPTDPIDHLERLRALRGRTHLLSTATVVRRGARRIELCTDVRVHFRSDLADEELQAYVATGEGSGCAGGYAVEALGGNLIERIEGDYPSVLGLQIHDVLGALRALGWRPSFPVASR